MLAGFFQYVTTPSSCNEGAGHLRDKQFAEVGSASEGDHSRHRCLDFYPLAELCCWLGVANTLRLRSVIDWWVHKKDVKLCERQINDLELIVKFLYALRLYLRLRKGFFLVPVSPPVRFEGPKIAFF